MSISIINAGFNPEAGVDSSSLASLANPLVIIEEEEGERLRGIVAKKKLQKISSIGLSTEDIESFFDERLLKRRFEDRTIRRKPVFVPKHVRVRLA